MKIADITENFNPFAGVDAGVPKDFVETKNSELAQNTDRYYEFIGKDGFKRILHIGIGVGDASKNPMQDPRQGHGLQFAVTAYAIHDFIDGKGDIKDRVLNHGRGRDVMRAVVHTIKQHVERTNPSDISYFTGGQKHRLYRALFNKMGINSYRFEPGSKSDPIGMFIRND